MAGDSGGAWSLVREGEGRRLFRGSAPAPAARVALEPDAAWCPPYDILPAEAARRRASVEEDAALAGPLFAVRSVTVRAPARPATSQAAR